MSYELREGKIIRDEVTIGEVHGGAVQLYPGYEQYGGAVKKFMSKQESGELDWSEEEKRSLPKITTVRELIAAMQPYVAEVCPAMDSYYGDKTPAVLDWLHAHDSVRVQVLKVMRDER